MISLGTQTTIRIAISTYTCLAFNDLILNERSKAKKAGEDISEVVRDVKAVDWYNEDSIKKLRDKYKSFPNFSLPQGR